MNRGHTSIALAVAATLTIARGAHAQPASSAAAPAPAAVDATPAAAANDQAAQDRIMTLVRAGKCGAAKSEAEKVGDTSLADQIGTMCGARSSNPFPQKNGGGSGRRGGGRPGG